MADLNSFKHLNLMIHLLQDCSQTVKVFVCFTLEQVPKGETESVLIALDHEASRYFRESYQFLSAGNVTYDEHLFRSIVSIRHATLNHLFEFRYSERRQAIEAEGTDVEDLLCLQQLKLLAEFAETLAKEGTDSIPLDAIDFLESNGKAQSGILNGNHIWLGSEKSCVRARIEPNNVSQLTSRKPIEGRHCVAHLKSRSWNLENHYYGDRISIKLGVCLPKVCHSRHFMDSAEVRQRVDLITRTRLQHPFNGNRYLIDYLYCTPDSNSPLRQWPLGAKLFFLFITLWSLLFIHANIKCLRDSRLNKSKRLGDSWYDAFSVKDAWKSLHKRTEDVNHITPDDPNKSLRTRSATISGQPDSSDRKHSASSLSHPKVRVVNFDTFAGVRVIGTILTAACHVFMIFAGLVTDFRFWDELTKGWLPVVMMNVFHYVNLFYVMSAVLLTYLILTKYKQEDLLNPTLWLILIIKRYIRLFPAYFIIFWFTKYVAPYISSGSTWQDFRTDLENPRSYCDKESWWSMLSMVSQFTMPFGCIPQAWHLGVDFRMMFLIPFFIILLVKNRIAAYLAALAAVIAIHYGLSQVYRFLEVDHRILVLVEPHSMSVMVDRIVSLYVSLESRVSTYITGVLAGYFVYRWQIGKELKLPKWIRSHGLNVTLIITLISMLSLKFFVRPILSALGALDENYIPLAVTYYVLILKIIVEICMGIITASLACGRGQAWIREILSNNFAVFLANLSYGVYLIHLEMIWKTHVFTMETNLFLLLLVAIGYLTLSFFAAFVIYILFERPIVTLFKQLNDRMYKKKSSKD